MIDKIKKLNVRLSERDAKMFFIGCALSSAVGTSTVMWVVLSDQKIMRNFANHLDYRKKVIESFMEHADPHVLQTVQEETEFDWVTLGLKLRPPRDAA